MKTLARRIQNICILALLCGTLLEAQLPVIEFTYLTDLPAFGIPRDMIQDQRGLIWMGYSSSGTGLYVYDGTSVRPIIARASDSTSLSDVHINTVLEAPDGKIWMGTFTKGISVYDPRTDLFERIDIGKKTGTDIAYVHDIYDAKDGYLWFATAGGLVRYDPAKETYTLFRTVLSDQYHEKDIKQANHMRCVINDPVNPNLLWIGCLRGLLSFDKKAETFQYHVMPFIPGGEIGQQYAQFMIIDLLFLDSNRLAGGSWAGGVLIYNTRQHFWKQYRDPNVSPDLDIYYNIEMQDDHALWVCSMRGFGILNIDTEIYTYYDSIPSKAKSGNLGWTTTAMKFLNDQDFIVLGTLGGIIGHLPDAEIKPAPLYPPIVRSVFVDKRPLAPVNNTYPQRQVSLATEQNEVSFEIRSPQYSDVDSITYRYQLIGHDRTWRTHTGIGQIQYQNLKGGKYQLQYQSSLDGKTWVDGETWSVEKYRAFWQAAELKFIAAGVLCLGVIFYFVLLSRQKRKRRELEQSFQHLLAESEMSALRAQMNPHFIFNSLNSIKTYVLKQDTAVANKYLTRFAHLMRLVLRNSKSRLITLADELHALELYLEIEKLRFDDGFDSVVDVDEGIDPEAYYIPPMLVQPYVENAIWHGLMHKKERGLLHIGISNEKKVLHIIIQDNGIGRTQSAQQQNSETGIQKSFGTQITHDRIALIRKSLNIEAEVRIDDLYDDAGHATGTRVHLILPHIDPRSAHQMIDLGVQTSQ
jgi:hypothetical protein